MGNRPSVHISRTARCEAAYPSRVIVCGGCPSCLIVFLKKALAADTSCAAEPEVDRLSTLVYRSIEVSPVPAHLDIGLIDLPGATSGPAKAIPAFDEHRCIPMHPAQDGGMSKMLSARRHHLDQIAEAELVAQVPNSIIATYPVASFVLGFICSFF